MKRILLILSILYTTTLFSQSFTPNNWGRKVSITIESDSVSGSGNHTNFPCLLDTSNFPQEVFDADGSNPAKNGGGDLRFTTDEAGTNRIACEIVTFVTDNDPTNGVAEVWVIIPTLDYNDDTVIWCWYDSSSAIQPAIDAAYGAEAVWNSDFEMIQHLNETDIDGGANDIKDSSENDNDGTTTGMDSSDDVPAKIGNGFDFDGSDDKVTIANESNFDFERTDAFSISAWIEPDVINTSLTIFSKRTSSGDTEGYELIQSSDKISFTLRHDAANKINVLTPATSIDPAGTFYHITMTYDGTSDASGVNVYINGVDEGINVIDDDLADTMLNNVSPQMSGRVTTSYYSGIIDEEHVYNDEMTSGWAITEYNNQNTPGTFAIEGIPQNTGWGNKIHGVTNHAKVMGVPNASIKSVIGVE